MMKLNEFFHPLGPIPLARITFFSFVLHHEPSALWTNIGTSINFSMGRSFSLSPNPINMVLSDVVLSFEEIN